VQWLPYSYKFWVALAITNFLVSLIYLLNGFCSGFQI